MSVSCRIIELWGSYDPIEREKGMKTLQVVPRVGETVAIPDRAFGGLCAGEYYRVIRVIHIAEGVSNVYVRELESFNPKSWPTRREKKGWA